MTTWSEAIKARLMAYCRIDVLEDGEEDLLKTLYLSAVAYLAGADISEPEADTPRRAQMMPMMGETEMAMMWSTLRPTDRVSVTSSGSRAMERIRKEWTMLNCSNRMHST